MSSTSTVASASASCWRTGTTTATTSRRTRRASCGARSVVLVPLSQGRAEILEKIRLVLDADGDADQAFGDRHLLSPLLTHLPEDRVRDRYGQRAVVAEVARQHDDLQPVEERERIDHRIELEREQRAVVAKVVARERMLRMRNESGVMHVVHARMRAQEVRKRPRIRALTRHPQRERLGADRQMVCLLGG